MPLTLYTHRGTGQRVRTRASRETVETVVRVYQHGGTLAEASTAGGVSMAAAHRWMTALGLIRDNETAQRLRHDTLDLPREAARLYRMGLSSTEIADLHGCAHTSVLRALAVAGVERLDASARQFRSRRSRASRKKAVAVCRLVAAGKTYAQAGRTVGVSGSLARHYWHGRYNPYRVEDPS